LLGANDQSGSVIGEDDLVPLVLEVRPPTITPFATVKYEVTYNGTMRIWRSPVRGELPPISEEAILSGTTYEYVVRILGDVDGNGALEDADTNAFDEAVEDFAQFKDDYWAGYSEVDALAVCDMDGDGALDSVDRNLLIAAVQQNRIVSAPMYFWLEGVVESLDPVTTEIRACVDSDGDGTVDPEDEADSVLATFVMQEGVCSPTPGVIPGGTCDDPDFQSACYNKSGMSDEEGFGYGRLNWDPAQGFGPIDFPPLETDIVKSSSPLLPVEARHITTGLAHPKRVTHNGLVDVVTALPLLQETDFELPFGSAVFRHVRTYSHDPTHEWQIWNDRNFWWSCWSGHCWDTNHSYWDWNGHSWMMGENPIFLIDARYREIVSPSPKRCYFIPDSHHAIPFEWVPGTQDYVAPPWFDAILKHDGEIDTTSPEGAWHRLPTRFYVWLHRGTVKYTITPHYEDLWDVYNDDPEFERVVNVHESPEDGGQGFPYYGLVDSIEDRYGNAIRLHYCQHHQFACDNPETPHCTECCQSCGEKGQLKAVTLHPAGSTAPAWTLLYIHRAFFADVFPFEDTQYVVGEEHKLHAIVVYPHVVDVDSLPCLTLPADQFLEPGVYAGFTNLDDYDAVDAVAYFGLGDDWVIKAKYMYEEMDAELYYDQLGNPLDGDGLTAMLASGGQLKKATVVRRTDDGGEQRSHTIYWNESSGFSCPPPDCVCSYHDFFGQQFFSIVAVFYDATIERLQRLYADQIGAAASENFLLDVDSDVDIQLEDGSNSALMDLADMRLFRYEGDRSLYIDLAAWTGAADVDCMAPRGMDDLVWSPLWLTDKRGETERPGKFAIYQWNVYPRPVPVTGSSVLFLTVLYNV
jgi:hypothetical protein